MKKVLILVFVLFAGSVNAQGISEVLEYSGYVGMSNDSIQSEGRRFNDFMLESEGRMVHLNIALDEDQNDGYLNGRTKIFYFFAVYDGDDRLSGAEYHIMLDAGEDTEWKYNYDPVNRTIEGYFNVLEITGPQNGLMSVDLEPLIVKEMN